MLLRIYKTLNDNILWGFFELLRAEGFKGRTAKLAEVRRTETGHPAKRFAAIFAALAAEDMETLPGRSLAEVS